MKKFKCAECDDWHDVTELELSFNSPDACLELSPEQKDRVTHLDSDLCRIGRRQHYIRGLLPLPVQHSEQVYHLGVWAKVSAKDYKRYDRLFDSEKLELQPRAEGELANAMPQLYRQDTCGLAVEIEFRNDSRPLFHLRGHNHTLVDEQRNGLSEHRLHQFYATLAALMHRREEDTSDDADDESFWGLADDFIDLANTRADESDITQVSEAFLYAAARYNAFEACENHAEPHAERESIIDFYLREYEQMLRENLDEQLAKLRGEPKD